MEKNLINVDEFKTVLSELGDTKITEDMMTEEMKASQRRCEEYIEKHMEKNK